MSDNGIEMTKALVELQAKLPRITKDLIAKVKSERTGREYSYTFADLALISREVLPLLGKAGLAFTSRTKVLDGRFVLLYELRHISGEVLDGEWPLPDRGTPQEIGSAITYFRRYSLCAVTGLAPEDEDRDAIVAEKAARRQRRESSQPKADAAPKVKPMSADQQKRMQKMFEQKGLAPEDREERLAYVRKVLGRELRSAAEMSHDDAEKVLAAAFAEVAPAGEPK